MMETVASKEFSWAMGHRLSKQALFPGAFSKCRMLHGHNYKAVVSITINENVPISKTYTQIGMVLDFTLFSPIKKFIDKNLDHRFVVNYEDTVFIDALLYYARHQLGEQIDLQLVDPLEDATFSYSEGNWKSYLKSKVTNILVVKPFEELFSLPKVLKKDNPLARIKEALSSFVIFPCEPTAENIAQILHTNFQALLDETVTAYFDTLSQELGMTLLHSDTRHSPIVIETVKVYETDKAYAHSFRFVDFYEEEEFDDV